VTVRRGTYSLSAIIHHWSRSEPSHPAIVTDSSSLTYSDWAELSGRLAAQLAARGVCPGDRVLHLGRNRVAHPIIVAATSRTRSVLVGANWRLDPRELGYILSDAEPRVAFVDIEFSDAFKSACDSAASRPETVLLDSDDGLESLRYWTRNAPTPPPTIAPLPDDIATLIYTSGTTGQPKGVTITNSQLGQYLARPNPVPMNTATVFLVATPVFHIAGTCLQLAVLYGGGTMVLLPDPDPVHIVAAIERHRVTDVMLVPAQIQWLLDQLPETSGSIRSLRRLQYGASPMPAPLLARVVNRLPDVELCQAYGLSESVGPITYLGPEDHRRGGDIQRSAGRPATGIEIKIVDPDTAVEREPGQIGEIWCRSDQNCAGYWRRPADNARLFSEQWLKTGDLGYLREGYLYLTARMNDLIISGGENIYASEVEAILVQLDGVSEACVVGIPDRRWGETVVAALVPTPGVDLAPHRTIAACREKLAHYKCPTALKVVDELPRNATGKVLRHKVRSLFEQP